MMTIDTFLSRFGPSSRELRTCARPGGSRGGLFADDNGRLARVASNVAPGRALVTPIERATQRLRANADEDERDCDKPVDRAFASRRRGPCRARLGSSAGEITPMAMYRTPAWAFHSRSSKKLTNAWMSHVNVTERNVRMELGLQTTFRSEPHIICESAGLNRMGRTFRSHRSETVAICQIQHHTFCRFI